MRQSAIYIDRCGEEALHITRRESDPRWGTQARARGAFIPSVERDGQTAVDQEHWVKTALDVLGSVFGGATAYPKARGIWPDDERGGTLVRDEPVVIHCYTTPKDIQDPGKLAEVAALCRRMGREARQGEVGVVVGDEYFAIRSFTQE